MQLLSFKAPLWIISTLLSSVNTHRKGAEGQVEALLTAHTCHVAGREWSLDVDYGSATAETGAAYLAMLGIDAVLGLVTSVEKLTDTAVEGTPASPEKQNGLPQRLDVEQEHCRALVEICWRTILDTLSQLLSRSSGEALIVQLLKVSLSPSAGPGSVCAYL